MSGDATQRPAALLLDLDGTLVDSEHVHRAAFRAFFARRGWDVADLTPFTGRRAQDVFRTTAGPWTGSDPVALAVEVAACTPPDASAVPVPGAASLVGSAARLGVPVAVVTSAGPPWAEQMLGDVLGVRSHVEVLVTARDVVRGKPDPAGYALACTRLGVDPSRCAAVEDAPAGVLAALTAGVGEVLGIASSHEPGELLAAGATAVHPDLAGIAARLGLTG